ncbi:MAG: hypothetical protein U0166_08215 [Acidobacteriota bacterium]
MTPPAPTAATTGSSRTPRGRAGRELGRKEFDQAKRKVYYQEIQKIIYDEQPYTFLWNRGTFWAFNKRIRGVTTSPRGVFNFTPAEMAWWVKKSEQKYPAMMP